MPNELYHFCAQTKKALISCAVSIENDGGRPFAGFDQRRLFTVLFTAMT